MIQFKVVENLSGELFILAFLVSCLELFFKTTLKEGMIFDFYGNFLNKLSHKNLKLAEVLGLCSYCNQFWVGLFFYLLYFQTLSFTIFLFQGLLFVITKIFIRKFDIFE